MLTPKIVGSLIENIPQARQPERGASLSPRIKIFNRSLSQLEGIPSDGTPAKSDYFLNVSFRLLRYVALLLPRFRVFVPGVVM
jgi:hypothetical protein